MIIENRKKVVAVEPAGGGSGGDGFVSCSHGGMGRASGGMLANLRRSASAAILAAAAVAFFLSNEATCSHRSSSVCEHTDTR